MVKGESCFKKYSKALYEYFSGCDILGYNCISFDVQLIAAEFNKAGLPHPFTGAKIVDAYTIFKKRETRTLMAALKFYCKKDLVDAHSAHADAEATFEVVLKQMELYTDIGADVESLAAYCCDSEYADLARKIEIISGEFCFAFGKHKGKRILDEQGYAQVMLKNDFSEETKEIIRQVSKKEPIHEPPQFIYNRFSLQKREVINRLHFLPVCFSNILILLHEKDFIFYLISFNCKYGFFPG